MFNLFRRTKKRDFVSEITGQYREAFKSIATKTNVAQTRKSLIGALPYFDKMISLQVMKGNNPAQLISNKQDHLKLINMCNDLLGLPHETVKGFG